MKLFRRSILGLIIFFLIHNSSLLAHSSNADTIRLSAAININWFFGKNNASNFSIGGALGLSKTFEFGKNNEQVFMPHYEFSINHYGNGFGTSAYSKENFPQFDIVNTIGIHLGLIGEVEHLKERKQAVKSFTYMNANPNFYTPHIFDAFISSSFISNKNRQIHQLGSLGGNIGGVLDFFYYNDGPPFHKITLGDSYDRWWTGGGGFGIDIGNIALLCNKNIENITAYDFYLSTRYERFTGNVQNTYRIGEPLNHKETPGNNLSEMFYNKGMFTFSLKHREGLGLQFARLGDLENQEFQNFIHDVLSSPKHTNFSKPVRVYGIHFSSPLFYQTIEFPTL